MKEPVYAYLRQQLIEVYRVALHETLAHHASRPESKTAETIRERRGAVRIHRPGRAPLPPSPRIRSGDDKTVLVDAQDLPPAMSSLLYDAFTCQTQILDGRLSQDDHMLWQGRSRARSWRARIESEVSRGELPPAIPYLLDTAAELAASNRRIKWETIYARKAGKGDPPPFFPGA